MPAAHYYRSLSARSHYTCLHLGSFTVSTTLDFRRLRFTLRFSVLPSADFTLPPATYRSLPPPDTALHSSLPRFHYRYRF